MNAPDIILPDFLIADLYKTCLVDIDSFCNKPKESLSDDVTASVETPVLSPDKIKYRGENLKNITFIINQPDSTDINKDDLTFLLNILNACKLTVADIAIINAGQQQLTYIEIKELLSPLQIVLFDVEPSSIKLPFLIPPFQIQIYNDTAIMLAPALSVLNKPDKQGKLLKTKLWNSLKQLFVIS